MKKQSLEGVSTPNPVSTAGSENDLPFDNW